MKFEATRQLIAAALDAIEFPFPVEWEGGTSKPKAEKTYGRWTIQQGDVMPAVIGDGHTRSVGIVHLQVFIPENGGTAAATLAADVMATALDRLQLNDGEVYLTFDLVGMADAGRRDGYTQKNLACNFTRDVYKFVGTLPFAYTTPEGDAVYCSPAAAEVYMFAP